MMSKLCPCLCVNPVDCDIFLQWLNAPHFYLVDPMMRRTTFLPYLVHLFYWVPCLQHHLLHVLLDQWQVGARGYFSVQRNCQNDMQFEKKNGLAANLFEWAGVFISWWTLAVPGKDFAGRPGGGQAGPSTIDRTNKPPDGTRRPANWRQPGRHLKAKVPALDGKACLEFRTTETTIQPSSRIRSEAVVLSGLELWNKSFPKRLTCLSW